MSFYHPLAKNLSNLPGLFIKKKIVVIESDDWGSVRMPSKAVFDILQKKSIDLTSGDSLRYNLNDTLASSDDLSSLFETLTSFKDSNGNSAIFTPISLVTNPDFEKIKANNFQEYYYEPFTETLNRYPGCENSFSLWKEGIRNKLFVPQFHGREHLNVKVWINALQKNDSDTHLAFDYRCWGFNNKHPNNITYQAAFDLDKPADLEDHKEIITGGLKLFNEIFGYKASYFVPPNGPFNETLEKTAAESGIKYLSTSKIHHEPHGNGKYRKKFHYLGQKNKFDQLYITRNCFFEPNQEGKNWVDSCLADIQIAFRWQKPAVISSHRVNYIGSLNPKNRENGLYYLKLLLQTILKKWPTVEFMTSDQLGELIAKSKR
ncbi:MAG: polysaccharide (de)acetylase [Bacteroidetes bacterium]|nr:polysaccharide (de)acetylase [Bacteroidota bacterium]